MRLVKDDQEFIRTAREEIINICSESPELTELFGNFVLKFLRAYKKHREFAPEDFRLSDTQFTSRFSGTPIG